MNGDVEMDPADRAAMEASRARRGADVEWARRIIAREESGKNRPPAAVLRMARRALGMTEGAAE